MALNDFFALLLTAGGASAVASWILERIKAYSNISDPEVKRWIFFGVCTVLSVGSYCVITFVPESVLLQIAPYFGIVATVFLSVFLGNSFHAKDKLSASGTVNNPIITADVDSPTAEAIMDAKQ